MAAKNSHNSYYTSQVKNIALYLNSRSELQDSVLEQAIIFFEECELIQQKLNSFEQQKTTLVADSTSTSFKRNAKKSKFGDKIDQVTIDKKNYEDELSTRKNKRHKNLVSLCFQIISLCEGDNFTETLRKSAQFLGTIQLTTPINGSKIAHNNEQHKGMYKAALCLRLLDELILTKQIDDDYINQFLKNIPISQYRNFCKIDKEAYQVFIEQVKLPIVMAALIQDIGNYHPEAQKILTGECGKLDCFRVLDVEERTELLKINYKETNTYLEEGLGVLTYSGNSREERDEFNRLEKAKITFVKRLLKGAINPKKGIGNLLKVPQIYTSIILSTKNNYNYKFLPNVYKVLNKTAQNGACQQVVVDSLYKITGMFPQGYGVIYVPKAMDNTDLDFYEYAIVSQFYPDSPTEPKCRQATRNLTYISFGHDIIVKNNSNLFFPETKKLFSKVSKKRLLEILEKLVSNFEERVELDIIPRCWMPNDYFFHKNHQKLWTRQK